ncbi:MAG: glucose 1-dehydrogenase [Deltaproteobacteria bacterium]|jgi:NAD(P)-dependent dehydrogenase (short-subunit alcohol dehydrogenase family)|nr:glucose 1-dehydrogenase [Deltaproteobacteria bacterium]
MDIAKLFSLDGKTAIVIGGSRGLGKGIATGLLAMGARVIISSRTQKEVDATVAELTATGGAISGLTVDICSLANINAYVESCVAQTGHIDILVNSAGISISKPALDYTEDDWDQVSDTQLKYVFLMSQAVARHMREKGIHGKIINIASLASVLGLKNIVAYCASKGGIAQLTKALANEWARYGINVNAIGPGWFDTEMTKPLFKDPAVAKRFVDRIPLRRIGLPEDLIGTAIFLASPASDYITGQTIYVDGGWLIN